MAGSGKLSNRMAERLAGKIVVVTGASSGIGAELARLLARSGAVPVLLARRLDKLTEVASELPGLHGLFQVDVTDAVQVEGVVEAIVAQYGRIDAWVNNAGFGIFLPFIDTPVEKFTEMMDTNYMSLVHSTKAVLPHMLGAGRGVIVNVASVAGKIGSAKSTGYSASKHAALGFTVSLRAELVGTGVDVCAVNPGPIDTPFFDIADPSGGYKRNVEWLMLKPDKVVRAICLSIATGKADTTMPAMASIGAKLLHLFPNLLTGVAAKLLNRK